MDKEKVKKALVLSDWKNDKEQNEYYAIIADMTPEEREDLYMLKKYLKKYEDLF